MALNASVARLHGTTIRDFAMIPNSPHPVPGSPPLRPPADVGSIWPCPDASSFRTSRTTIEAGSELNLELVARARVVARAAGRRVARAGADRGAGASSRTHSAGASWA